jgi:excisionase family DNA binding protein
MRRRIEVVAFQRRRVEVRPAGADCLVCLGPAEMLTTRQAAALAQVDARSVRRWLAAGRAHGARTPGGQYRVCRNSLFLATDSIRIEPATPDDWAAPDARLLT